MPRHLRPLARPLTSEVAKRSDPELMMTALFGIDLDRDGKQSGYLAVPHSSNVSAYGRIMVPLVHIRNGDGARALLTAGVHGDEFEGQVALRNLCLELTQDDVRGSLLILPMANAPAVLSSSRVSPIDGLNLNRAFPGHPLGLPTAMIANSIETRLLAHCDFAYDIHSGGSSLLYEAVAMTASTGSEPDDRKRLDLLRALGLDIGMLLPADGDMGLETAMDGAMLRQGVIGVSAEFGGGGMLSADMLQQCERSIRSFLAHVGLTPNVVIEPSPEELRIYDVSGPGAHVYCESPGIFKADISVGSVVGRGESIGRIYDRHDVLAPPRVVRNVLAGRVLALRSLPLVNVGDCLVQVGTLSGSDGGGSYGS